MSRKKRRRNNDITPLLAWECYPYHEELPKPRKNDTFDKYLARHEDGIGDTLFLFIMRELNDVRDEENRGVFMTIEGSVDQLQQFWTAMVSATRNAVERRLFGFTAKPKK